MAKEKRRLYIAYGSNLNLEQMARRCPTAKIVGTAVLENWRLIFNSVASVERFKGGSVPVLVWDIQPSDEAELDIYEGYPRLYRKEMVRVKLDGKLVNAMIYIMNNVYRESPPSTGYYNVIRDGYISAGFNINILQDAVRRSYGKGGISMDSTVKEQILRVRDTGKCNMLSINEVQRIAFDMEFYELVNFIEENRKTYINFIFTGKED